MPSIQEVLGENQIIQCKEAFSLFDKNGSGQVSRDDLGDLMRSVGRNPTDQELQDLLREADVENTGSINFESFIIVMSNSVSTLESTEELLEAFQFFDKEGLGVINTSQLKDILTNSEEKFSDEDIGDLLKLADEYDTGYVNYKDLAQVMTLL